MKKLFLIVISLLTQISFAQNYEEENIFDTNEKGILILKPHIEKEINEKITPIVKQKVDSIKIELQKDEYLNKEDFQKELKFAQDTIQIRAFIDEYQNYPSTTTTLGMIWSSGYELEMYQNLLNKEYKELISWLPSKIKKEMIKSQNLWQKYYNNECSFIHTLNDFGNYYITLYSLPDCQKIIENRLYFLRDIGLGKFQGSWQWEYENY